MADNGLDSTKYAEFSEKYPEHRPILDILFRETQYYTLAQIMTMLTDSIRSFISQRDPMKPLVIVMYIDKIGSEQYFYNACRHLLPPHYIHFQTNNNRLAKITVPTDLLVIDDWSLSGCNLYGTFDNILCECDQYKNPMITLNAVVAITTLPAIEGFIRTFEPLETKFYYSTVVPSLAAILIESNEGAEQIITYMQRKQFYNYFSPDIQETAYPIHLDYKVANQFGSYPNIYLPCRHTEPNKEFMQIAKNIVTENSALDTTTYSDNKLPKKVINKSKSLLETISNSMFNWL
jgi:hypothetical protein